MSFSPNPKVGSRIKKWLRLLGPLLLIAYILFAIENPQLILAELQSISIKSIALAFGLCFVHMFLKAFRWNRLLGDWDCAESFATSLRVYGDAMFWGTLTPGRVGEFRKSAHLKRLHGIGLVKGIWLNAVDRIFDLLALLIWFTWGTSALPVIAQRWPQAQTVSLALIACAISGLFLLPSLRRQLEKLLVPKPDSDSQLSIALRVKSKLAQLALSFSRLKRFNIFLAISVSVVSMGTYVLMLRALADSTGHDLSFAQTCVCVCATMLAGLIPISYFNFGPREAVLIGLFASFSLSKNAALSFSLLFVLCYLILMSCGSVFWLWDVSLKPKEEE